MKKVFLLFVLIIVLVFFPLMIKKRGDIEKKLLLEEEKQLVKTIKGHYNQYVITNDVSKLYKLIDDSYIEYGEINKGVTLELSNLNIDKDTEYFHIEDLDLYIPYVFLTPIDKFIKDNRYINYIPFNSSVRTNNKIKFYDEDDNYLYSIYEQKEFPIIVKDSDRYGVVFNDNLLYIHSDDVLEVYNNENTTLKFKNRIKVLTYHFIYNQEVNTCSQSICQSFEMFESHLKYIRENDFFTLKLNELEMFLDGKINIPEKSIVITIDDGTILDDGIVDLIEKYQANVTIFVITGRGIDLERLKSNYIDFESHTDNMHNAYECSGYGMQGGGILCLPEEQVLNDLKTSQEKLGGSKYFAYPFFDFNARAIELLKKAGFTMAFIGQYDTDGFSYPLVTDKFKVRRKTIFSDITLNEFISYLK